MATGWGRGTWGSDYFGATSVEVSLTGVAATASLGTPVIQPDCNVSVTGLASTAAVGAVTTIAEANVALPTLAISSGIGSVIVFENEVIIMPSLAITSAINAATTNAAANVSLVGQSATFTTGSIFIWGEIDDSQTPNYSGVATSQDPNYTSITAGRDAA